MIQGLFFDLDGTLVNTYEADFLAYRDAIQEVSGVVVEQEAFYATHGMEMVDKLERLVPELSTDRYPEVRAAKKKYYKQYIHTTVVNEALVKLAAQFTTHKKCVIVTTAKRENVESVLRHHDLLELFPVIICGDDVSKPKPDPEAYLIALEKTGLRPDEVIAFEDSPTGIASAKAAGIAVIEVREYAST